MNDRKYIWNRRFEELHEEALFSWRDLITKDSLSILAQDWRKIVELTSEYVQTWQIDEPKLEQLTKKVYELFVSNDMPQLPYHNEEFSYNHFCLLPSFKLTGATMADRALLCSAVAYCLAYDNGYKDKPDELNRLRLSAMTLELAEIIKPPENNIETHYSSKAIYDRIREQASELYKAIWRLAEMSAIEPVKPGNQGSVLGKLLYCANLVSSNRLKMDRGQRDQWWKPLSPTDLDEIEATLDTISDKTSFQDHPLVKTSVEINILRVALISGGATKIKSYFLESARLPEIRGASTLLDRINLEDIPALFGDHQRCQEEYRFKKIRIQFKDRTEHELTAPECIIYANGGNILAFAPVSIASQLAQEIENIYTRETLIGNSVAVSKAFDLIELQYGLRPKDYWVEDFTRDCADTNIRSLINSTYRHPLKSNYSVEDLNEGERREAFFYKKCFGELGTVLALEQFHRREGNPIFSDGDRDERSDRPTRIHPPHYEVLPQARRCSSCERRPAIIEEPEDSERYLCVPCGRKRLAGRRAESQRSDELYPHAMKRLSDSLGWDTGRIDDWVGKFLRYLEYHVQLRNEYLKDRNPEKVVPAQDLAEIADSRGFVGLIYADGNNVGSIIEQTKTSAQYKQFAQRLFFANQQAVFQALGEILRPHDRIPTDERPKETLSEYQNPDSGTITVHPFEIISIGGDDLFLFVPGEYALEITLKICSNLEQFFASQALYEESQQKAHRAGKQIKDLQRYLPNEYETIIKETQPAVSLSAGVVIANCHTPVYFMEQLGSQLLKLAKQYAKELKAFGYRGGTIDFMALKSVTSIISEIGTFRRNALEWEDNAGAEKLKLWARPYTLHELNGLIKTAREFKARGIPSSQLYALRSEVLNRRHGRLTSTLDYLYFRARASKEISEVIKEHFEIPWWGESARWLHPWREVNHSSDSAKTFETILYDLIEIYDFVSAG